MPVADARSRFTNLCGSYSRGVSEPAPAVLELIGNTPLVRVTRLDTGPCALFLKLESQNPGGSIKDRIGLSMIEAAERDGRLGSGGVEIGRASCRERV